MSELLSQFRHEFNSKATLMPSDIKFEGDHVGIWLRAEKVPSELGTVVEVWRLEGYHYLDPVIALEHFVRLRSEIFGEGDDLPLFIHSDGSNLSKAEFNTTLQDLLSKHPELVASPRDFWGGHSFRPGGLVLFLCPPCFWSWYAG